MELQRDLFGALEYLRLATQTWLQLEAQLKNLSNDELLDLLRDLYTLHAESRRFLAATPAERAAPYR